MLHDRLKAARFSMWIDEDALRAGVKWSDQIATAIRYADVMLVCLSQKWNSGGYVHKEIGLALDQIKARPDDLIVIPVLLEECDIPAQLSHLHAIPLFNDGGYKKLVTDLREESTYRNPASVIEALDRRINKHPTAKSYVERGYAHGRLNGPERAIKDFDEAIRLDRTFASAYKGRGHAYTALAEGSRNPFARSWHYLSAVRNFTQAMALRANDCWIYCGRADCYASQGKNKKALADFDKALQLSPKSVEALIGRGYAFMALKDYQNGILDFTSALILEPEEPEAYDGRAQCYGLLRDHPQAIRDYDRAIELDPQNARAFMRRSWAKQEVGDRSGAQADEKMAESLNCDL